MTNSHIRDAQPGDAEAIRAVTLAAYQEYAAILPEHWESYKRDILQTLSNVGTATQLVAEQDSAIVGSVLLYPASAPVSMPDGSAVASTWPEIRLLAVKPSARGQGIGESLVRACIARARQAGAPAITLHTTDIMQVAMRMYERMGFVRAPDLDFYPVPDMTIKGYRFALDNAEQVV